MKVLVVGSQDSVKKAIVTRCLDLIHGPQATQPMTELVSTGFKGVDKFARDWSTDNGIPIQLGENPLPSQYGEMEDQLGYGRAIARGMPEQILAFITTDFLHMFVMTVKARAEFFDIPICTLYVTTDWQK